MHRDYRSFITFYDRAGVCVADDYCFDASSISTEKILLSPFVGLKPRGANDPQSILRVFGFGRQGLFVRVVQHGGGRSGFRRPGEIADDGVAHGVEFLL